MDGLELVSNLKPANKEVNIDNSKKMNYKIPEKVNTMTSLNSGYSDHTKNPINQEDLLKDGVRVPYYKFDYVEVDDSQNYITDDMLRNLFLNKSIARENTTYPKKTLTAYDLFGCARKLSFRLLSKAPTDAPTYPYSNLAMDIGSATHNLIQNLIWKDNVKQCTEIPIKQKLMGFNLSMKCDGIYKNQTVVEFKTIDDIATIADNPKKDHVEQAMLYAFMLNRFMGYNITAAQIIYVSRGKLDVKCFLYNVSASSMTKVRESLYKKLMLLREVVTKRVLPDMNNEFINLNDCTFCSYRSMCKNENERVK